MKPKILLVNPPIYDFAAYDFWLKPSGLLSVAGFMRGKADFKLFDYLDRQAPFMAGQKKFKSDRWGRGRFYCEHTQAPTVFKAIPRYFRRFGLPRRLFADFLAKEGPFDFVMIQTTMTYWYNGLQEVIEDVHKLQPQTKIILGGNYVTLCCDHAQTLGADLLVKGTNLELLWEYLAIPPDLQQPALWEVYDKLNVGVLKLTEGCPFNCTYCSVPKVYGKFKPRSLEHSLGELELLCRLGVGNVAFYDDALLFEAEKVLIPFLSEVLKRNLRVNFHSPNALNARFITSDIAEIMVRAGFKTFYLGFESASQQWQQRTGSKVFSDELAQATRCLLAAGAEHESITAYQILGHPHIDIQELEASMRFVGSLGIRGMLADFSPIPGTPDGEYCRKWVDLNEPLMHNKTAFPIIMLGFDESNRLKDLQRQLNRERPEHLFS
ncbi:MAG TPA: B12-binding domain-containing radical SAM protein [Sedimentisphaerales bacterium]|nr:B12-binding domain-containing radical SAM protein [Sedimentisphaerales bacterium]